MVARTIRLAVALLGVLSISVVYSLQQLARLCGAPNALVVPKNPPPPGAAAFRPRSVDGRLYIWTRRLLLRCGDPAIVLFLFAEEFQAKLLQLLADLFSMRFQRWCALPGQLGHQSRLARAALGEERSISIQQAKNTRYIFVLVRNNPEVLRIPPAGEIDLVRYVEKAYGMGEFESIWTVEGLGHVYTQRTWSRKWGGSRDARGILTDGQAENLPLKSLTMMHAGLGLGFAESLLQQLSPDAQRAQVAAVVETFLQLCRNNSRAGYVGCALESLGLVTRCFNYHLVIPIQTVLAETDVEAWEYFWRGVGRAIYFAPAHLAQPLYSPWIAAQQEAPNAQVLEILKSAITWPANIVNMRTPEIFERFVLRYGIQPGNEAAIIQGVAASTTMAVDITPGSSVVERYLQHVPTIRDPRMDDLWERLVRRPVHDAMYLYQPALHRHRMMDQVFRFRDMNDIVRTLVPPPYRAKK